MKKEMIKLRDKLYKHSKLQKEGAWKERDFKKAKKIREKEQASYEKWKLLAGILKEMEKQENEDK